MIIQRHRYYKWFHCLSTGIYYRLPLLLNSVISPEKLHLIPIVLVHCYHPFNSLSSQWVSCFSIIQVKLKVFISLAQKVILYMLGLDKYWVSTSYRLNLGVETFGWWNPQCYLVIGHTEWLQVAFKHVLGYGITMINQNIRLKTWCSQSLVTIMTLKEFALNEFLWRM